MLNLKLQEKLLASRWLANILGLKAIYKFIYIIFNLIIVKKLNVDEYGIYSYIVALIVYFSSIPLLGLPVYLQKNIARGNTINFRYFLVTTWLAAIALFIAFRFVPNMTMLPKLGIIIITFANCLIGLIVSIKDGFGRYSFQYKFFFLTGLWMVACIVHATIFKREITFNIILIYWVVNSLIAIFVCAGIFLQLARGTIKIIHSLKTPYTLIFMDLLLLYVVSIPDNFARFYDRYLAQEFFGNDFLGIYSFNLMIVTMIYSLFIRPINSVLVTELAKRHASLLETMLTIKKYYRYGTVIYLGLLVSYAPFSQYILAFLGLSKYEGTLSIFMVCATNAVFYFLTLPFVYLITLSENNRTKLAFAIISLCVFNVPYILLAISSSPSFFYAGFILAYLGNLLVAILFNYKFAWLFFKNYFTPQKLGWNEE